MKSASFSPTLVICAALPGCKDDNGDGTTDSGSHEAREWLIDSVPGADGTPHDRLTEGSHFLQEDQGEEIDGWTYRARTLEADLVLVAQSEATIVQDDLSNTYQRR